LEFENKAALSSADWVELKNAVEKELTHKQEEFEWEKVKLAESFDVKFQEQFEVFQKAQEDRDWAWEADYGALQESIEAKDAEIEELQQKVWEWDDEKEWLMQAWDAIQQKHVKIEDALVNQLVEKVIWMRSFNEWLKVHREQGPAGDGEA